MYLRELAIPLEKIKIKGIGPAAMGALAKAGINSVETLLRHYPRDWEDRSRIVPLREYSRQAVCTTVTVLAHDWFGFGRMRTLKVHVEDESGRAVLVCFQRPFLEKQLIPGKQYRLWGNFSFKYGEIQAAAFEIEPYDPAGGAAKNSGSFFGKILPVYHLSAGLSQALLRRLVRFVLDQYAAGLESEIPEAIIARDGLLQKSAAISAIHFPASQTELERARKTLIYEELFFLEVMIGKRALERRRGRISGGKVPSAASDFSPLQKRMIERLPFSLTAGQKEAAVDINRDMNEHWPMARLLQGDVGSGKTLVSFLAALPAIEQGGQAAVMAPTELLARQHAENAARLLEPIGVRPAFLTGNIKAAGRSQLLKRLASGEIDLVIGTHALFSKDVVYKNLRMVVVDEQHRFGVAQRQAITAKGDHTNFLMMSSTPIPRTLAFTAFGDLDVSEIRDLPPGRKPVKTHLAKQSNEDKVYDFVRKELAAGRQAYFVYPLIEAGDSDLTDAETMAEKLGKKIFPQYKTALIHSRLDDEQKRQTMEAFRSGEIRILAATSVVEVGVDVPNASCMVICHAERFGLSALHQLRGRVGRGADQSYCFLVYSEPPPDPADIFSGGLSETGKTRLKVMLENNDGFVIAEEDLKLRGPGQIIGTEQSGFLSLGIADPLRDIKVLEQARADAFAMLENDPGLLQLEHLRVAAAIGPDGSFADGQKVVV
ncbi:ATP-dependent DNA helicase RecG [Spirochaetia bacterium]|nr:ATP-dependent DNA helicase RecG [Spirochaetia bacterium]